MQCENRGWENSKTLRLCETISVFRGGRSTEQDWWVGCAGQFVAVLLLQCGASEIGVVVLVILQLTLLTETFGGDV